MCFHGFADSSRDFVEIGRMSLKQAGNDVGFALKTRVNNLKHDHYGKHQIQVLLNKDANVNLLYHKLTLLDPKNVKCVLGFSDNNDLTPINNKS